MAVIAESERLAIRDWVEADAEAALEIFGSTEVARWLGMEWVGETDKYYGLAMQVYRIRAAELDGPERASREGA